MTQSAASTMRPRRAWPRGAAARERRSERGDVGTIGTTVPRHRYICTGSDQRHTATLRPVQDLLFRPVTELAVLLRDGEIGARELTEAALAAIEAHDDGLNAFVDVDPELALAEADAVPRDAPAHGIPVAVKANVAVAGRPQHFGSRFLRGYRATEDAYLVRRLREAGFVVVGLTNLPEFGILPTTEPRFGGPTRNPWDPSRTPGGSSGGSAAALAAGMVPVAHGNDGGGSIRIPAACCHLVGLKAS